MQDNPEISSVHTHWALCYAYVPYVLCVYNVIPAGEETMSKEEYTKMKQELEA